MTNLKQSFLAGLSLTWPLLAACNGALFINQPAVVESCDSSSQCGPGRVCGAAGTCTDSEGPCSAARPTGDCPLGRVCIAGGVCVTPGDTGGGAWCACTAPDVCVGGTCQSGGPACGTAEVHGSCPSQQVCVGGQCTTVLTGINDCTPERPLGLCPSGAVCDAGYCVPVGDDPCGPSNQDGQCEAGEVCQGGSCQSAPCSQESPFGVCVQPDYFCNNGECVHRGTLETCESLECAQKNRLCDTSGEFPVCGLCVATHYEDPNQVCQAHSCDTLCTPQHRTCDDSSGLAVCAGCAQGYKPSGDACVPTVCSDLNCASEHRQCSDGGGQPASCTACLPGYIDDGLGECVEAGCADLDCAAEFRECDDSGALAVCTTCLSGYSENGSGQCVECFATSECMAEYNPEARFCDEGFCVHECTVDADCPGGGANYRCNPYGQCAPTAPVGDACAAAVLEGTPVEPTLMLLIDQSGSMTEAYGGTNRWDAVSDALFNGTNGVVTTWEDQVRFGLALYTYDFSGDGQHLYRCCDPSSASNSNNNFKCATGAHSSTQDDLNCVCGVDTQNRSGNENVNGNNGWSDAESCKTAHACILKSGPECGSNAWNTPWASNCMSDTCDLNGITCPQVTYAGGGTPLVGTGLRDDLFAVYDANDPLGATPTGESVELVATFLDTLASDSPKYILLATDGEPDHCRQLDPNDATNVLAPLMSIEAIEGAFDSDIRTFILAVGDDVGISHLRDIANAGAGIPPACRDVCVAPNDPVGCCPEVADPYQANDPTALATALNDIIGEVLSCQIQLNTTGQRPLSGVVYLDGEPLPQSGWSLTGPESIIINDPYCDTIKDGGSHFVSVEFDVCEVGG